MSYLTANDRAVLSARISFPGEGAWMAALDVNVGDADDFTDAVSIASYDGAFALAGTVWTPPGGAVRAGTTLDKRTTVTVIGGADGLGRSTLAKGYTQSPVRLPLADILLAAGETLSPTVTDAVLDTPIGRWTLPVLRCDTALRRLAAAAGSLTWRVLPDGTVWLGSDAWEEVEPAHQVVGEAPEQGRMTIAPKYGETPLMPGVTFRERRVTYVVHSVDEVAGLRSDVTFESSAGGRLRGALERIVDRRVDERGLPFGFPYAAKVVSQNGNGTFELILDDTSMPKLSAVPYYPGLPGAEVDVEANARCYVHFANGDAKKPYIANWHPDGLSEMRLGGAGGRVIRDGEVIAIAGSWTPGGPIVIGTITLHPSMATDGDPGTGRSQVLA